MAGRAILKKEVIAEIGQNHNGDMVLAKELIYAAKEAGANVAKFQLYDAKKLFERKNNDWYEYNCKTELSYVQVQELAEICEKVEIEFMASVFDCIRIGWLEEVGVKRYKLASRSIQEKSLIKEIANKGKPILVSLGMWDKKEFPQIKAENRVDFLYCVSKYPTELTDLKLLEVDFAKYAGFSDHTIGVEAAMIALSRGARILEKHFTLDKKMYGPDHLGSMTPSELSEITRFCDALEAAL